MDQIVHRDRLKIAEEIDPPAGQGARSELSYASPGREAPRLRLHRHETAEGRVVTEALLRDTWVELLATVSPATRGALEERLP
ncbi:hypothetical protein PHK61_26755 [Actinomycetospora lutea]|uniref:hypothetical protein n=1 Tax=Actinomycetospora lutea TaxID=663604 RepID=UPI0023663CF9|nr:hypothetical protein [Actinomycetospora lutea]MDD7942022.1 hypothetical protein [Actinomycetospora lutea]